KWLQGMHYRLFFMINGPLSKHTNYPPVPLPSATAVVIALVGILATLFGGRRVFAGQPFLVFVALLIGLYGGLLWYNNYSEFIETGQPVAINGRYLIPLLSPDALVIGRAISLQLQPWPRLKAWATALAIVLFLQ